MPDYPIDLGKEIGPMTAPTGGYGSLGKEGPDMHYPTLYLDNLEGDTDIPDDGTMTVRFHKTSETVTNREGKTDQCCCIEVRQILSVKGGKAIPKEETSAADILDALRAAIEKESPEEDAGEAGEE